MSKKDFEVVIDGSGCVAFLKGNKDAVIDIDFKNKKLKSLITKFTIIGDKHKSIWDGIKYQIVKFLYREYFK